METPRRQTYETQWICRGLPWSSSLERRSATPSRKRWGMALEKQNTPHRNFHRFPYFSEQHLRFKSLAERGLTMEAAGHFLGALAKIPTSWSYSFLGDLQQGFSTKKRLVFGQTIQVASWEAHIFEPKVDGSSEVVVGHPLELAEQAHGCALGCASHGPSIW